MDSFDFKYNLDHVDIYFMGDVHLGELSCKFNKFLGDIETVEKQHDAKVILMGDLLNCGTKNSVGAGPYSESINTQAQYDQMCSMLQNIKDKILLCLIGNHEQRIINETSINPILNLCNVLDINYGGYSAFLNIKVKDINYTIFATHGSSGSTKYHTKLAKVKSLSHIFDADIYAMGHMHDLIYAEDTYKGVKNGEIVNKSRFYVVTGSYLGYDGSYAEMKLYEPGKLGCAKLRLHGKKRRIEILQ